MEIESEEVVELKRLGAAINTGEQISIMDLLYEDEECTIHQLCNALDMLEEEAEKHLAKLEELLMIEHQLIITHPLTKERIYYLTGRGKRYYGALRKIVEFEFAVLESAVEKNEDDLTLLTVIDEFNEVNAIDLDDLTYILRSLGAIKDNNFIVDYSGLHSWKLKASIEQMIREGLIRDRGTAFHSYTLTREGKTFMNSNSSNDRNREIIRELRRNSLSPFRFALYCRVVDTENRGEVFRSAERLGLAEDEIASYEKLYTELKQLHVKSYATIP
jgi:predicted transcriptional regulator